MKNLLILLFCLISSSILFAQNELEEAIERLSIDNYEEQDRASGTIYTTLNNSPSTIKKKEAQIRVAILKGLKIDHPNFGLYHLLLDLVSADAFSLSAELEEKILTAYTFNKIEFKKRQINNYQKIIWDDDDYLDNRYETGVLLDLMGYMSGTNSMSELQEALELYTDRKILLFAVTSLLKRGVEAPEPIIQNIASDSEARTYLFGHLRKLKKKHLFPKIYHNQRSLSESDMINWLLYPTAFNRMPDDIQLINTYSAKYNGVGKVVFYLWKFKSNHEDWKEKSWMVGLSGPFRYKDMPTDMAYGFTFSRFDSLEDYSLDEHFEKILEALEESYTYTKD